MSTPTPETALARRWRWQLNMGTAEAPEWTTVMGVTDFKPPMPDPNIEDSSDYESEGWNGNTKTAQSWELTTTLNRKVNDRVKTYHPTHEKLRPRPSSSAPPRRSTAAGSTARATPRPTRGRAS